MSAAPSVDVVIPTAGRPSLGRLLGALATEDLELVRRVFVVDDRPEAATALPGLPASGPLAERIDVLRARACGPAAARNVGWRAAGAEWIAFLDDDVVPAAGWGGALARDLHAAGPDVAGTQGRVRVPLPQQRPPTDWERNVRGLEDARWATADMAYRRRVLAAVGGFDERFPRAYREDADLGLRVTRAGWRIVRGSREVSHPPGRSTLLAAVRRQAGNADDVLMRALHGRGWRQRAGAPRGRLRLHLATTVAGCAAAGALVARRPAAAATAGTLWLCATAEFAWRRIAPGPRTAGEVSSLALTSLLIPPAATGHFALGLARRRSRLRDPGRAPAPGLDVAPGSTGEQAPDRAAAGGANGRPVRRRPAAVLLDRDGTLVVDVPYNGDPERVSPMPGARSAVERLRRSGVGLAVVSNQSGVGRGVLTREHVVAVNRRVEELLGPLGPWLICPHAPDEVCGCRKPAPGLVLRAAEALGVAPAECAVVGDIGADIEAARAAGARGVLVPTPRTRPEEVEAAEETAPDLESAVQLLIGGER